MAIKLCRIMLERDRIKEQIKKHTATIKAFRLLWTLSQRSRSSKRPTGKEAAARARAAREQSNGGDDKALTSGEAGTSFTETGFVGPLRSDANPSREFWKSATKAADQLAKANGA